MRLSICVVGMVAVACSSGSAGNDLTDSIPGAPSAIEVRPAADALAVIASWRALSGRGENPDGSLGAWSETLGIADSRAGVSATVIGDFLYVLGGRQESSTTVLIGRVDRPTGAVLSWNSDPANSFVGQRANPAVIVRGNRLYISGGSGSGGQMADIDPTSGNFISWR